MWLIRPSCVRPRITRHRSGPKAGRAPSGDLSQRLPGTKDGRPPPLSRNLGRAGYATHTPLTQFGVAPEQTTPHPPQLSGSAETTCSHPFAGLPSQSAKPWVHAYWHCPPTQWLVAFGTGGQTAPLSITPSQSSSIPLQISCCGTPATALQRYALPSAEHTIVPSR